MCRSLETTAKSDKAYYTSLDPLHKKSKKPNLYTVGLVTWNYCLKFCTSKANFLEKWCLTKHITFIQIVSYMSSRLLVHTSYIVFVFFTFWYKETFFFLKNLLLQIVVVNISYFKFSATIRWKMYILQCFLQ